MTDDATLGGYLTRHERPPAFQGCDGRAYSVAVLVDDQPDAEGCYGAALLFVRWSQAGDAPDGHVETGQLARAATPEAAGQALRAFSLHEVKAWLDQAVAARAQLPDW